VTRKSLLAINSMVACFMCSACSRAPSVSIIGSFFPVWMICLTVGVVTAFVVRVLLLRYKLENQVGPLWLFYPSSVTLSACLLWLIFYR
jgi:hypothetical protein